MQSSVRRSHSATSTTAEDKRFPLRREAGSVGVTRRVGHAQCRPSMRAGSPAELPIPSAPAVRKPLDPRTWLSLKHPPACVSKPGGRSSPAKPGLAVPPVRRDDLSSSLHLCHSLGGRLLLLSGSLFWHAHQVVLSHDQPLGWGRGSQLQSLAEGPVGGLGGRGVGWHLKEMNEEGGRGQRRRRAEEEEGSSVFREHSFLFWECWV